ncbi:Acetyl-coenzyme A carboxyl transferase alpha chain / Acetyl-coenzyme A carboxyl transferase beta chain [[Actinomadura] parvosata subsp. kistnae]|uniref:Acetyl-CoA carboxyl transferase n=2 Tax=Nonomuraea TaxID=83681 RepID=A0A1U9ZR18_9ACTN|nr:carboxyl transferase domain-containing protein [Nonomuraea sp. ATCC 55076]AQZ60390.1 acetyl-CoA carboxyl transferase [Nonomuraea sp. ATCC 55076]NJP89223.1 acetyl-CoA carboxyl transferase [Nonomuraea sp. FMUSA5-5]SPL91089.1 Acetyl-coenzyme A carboxyl transferase alpha chain / Acetyl-coenzyme A carboxyl transferase beta chain [Actinomadura parvosata subsp. kistnae]
MSRPDARTLIETILDRGSWKSWDAPPADPAEPGSSYADELAAARVKSGYDEAVITGEGLLDGRRVAVVACEFSFMAGSIGVVAAERFVSAAERAARERLPLLALPASGGTRMQEGALGFVQMVKITAAIQAYRAVGLPYLVYLRHPTTGGVFASWGSLGHVTVAEPGALIGFLGPRVFESLHGYPFPEGVQVSENLHAKGLLDAVVSAEEAREAAVRALAVLAADRDAIEAGQPPEEDLRPVEAWEAITRSRRDDRPGLRTLLKLAATDVTRLSGTGEGKNEPGLLLALARFGTAPAVVLGQDRRLQRAGSPLGPAGLRVARRGMRLAAELGLPLVTVIDSAGSELSKAAEEGGLAAEISRCLAELVMLEAPTVCLLLGEGAGGAALALLPADRVLCAQHAWLAPLPPEGASAILYRSVDFAPEIAQAQHIRATDLRRDGIVDRVIPELPDAAYEPRQFCERVGRALEHEIAQLLRVGPADRFAARQARYRNLG